MESLQGCGVQGERDLAGVKQLLSLHVPRPPFGSQMQPVPLLCYRKGAGPWARCGGLCMYLRASLCVYAESRHRVRVPQRWRP